MPAELIHRFRDVTDAGHIVEMAVWRVPEPIPPPTHGLKYRLAYIVDGQRAVGFNHERGKGDHCHLDGQERPYAFVSLDQLLEDFIREVERRRTP